MVRAEIGGIIDGDVVGGQPTALSDMMGHQIEINPERKGEIKEKINLVHENAAKLADTNLSMKTK